MAASVSSYCENLKPELWIYNMEAQLGSVPFLMLCHVLTEQHCFPSRFCV